jgi:hypothetical protein
VEHWPVEIAICVPPPPAPIPRGDIWGPVAHHYSGDGWSSGGSAYVTGVKQQFAERPWIARGNPLK